MSEPLPTEQYRVNGATAGDDLVVLYMGRREALLIELSYIEDYLINRGRLRRRSTETRMERKERGIATKIE